MNHLLSLKELNNTYWALRHGQARHNVLNIAVGNLQNGAESYGLTHEGEHQIKRSIEQSTLPHNETIIFHSPFLRTFQSAEIAAKTLDVENIFCEPRLRERGLGNFELQEGAQQNYERMWNNDKEDPTHTHDGVESVMDVMNRTTEFIAECEKHLEGKTILLVSHGDTISILRTAFAEGPEHLHHENFTLPSQGELLLLERKS